MYTDDTKIYREISSPLVEKNMMMKVQDDLKKVSSWSERWLLQFHPNKCFSIAIGNLDMNKKIDTANKILGIIRRSYIDI